MATPSPKSTKLYHIFAVVCTSTRFFLSRGKFYFSRPPPCGGKSKSRFRPVKSRVKRTSAPRANARICLFTKCPRPPPPRPPATAPEPLRGREVGFAPLRRPSLLCQIAARIHPNPTLEPFNLTCTSLPRSCPFNPLQPTKSAATRPLIHCGLPEPQSEGWRPDDGCTYIP